MTVFHVYISLQLGIVSVLQYHLMCRCYGLTVEQLLEYVTSALGDEQYRLLIIICFDNYFNCHLQGEYAVVGRVQLETAMFAKFLDISQHPKRFITESRSDTLNSSRENLKTSWLNAFPSVFSLGSHYCLVYSPITFVLSIHTARHLEGGMGVKLHSLLTSASADESCVSWSGPFTTFVSS